MHPTRKLGYTLAVVVTVSVMLNVFAALGERLVYGAWWADGRPVGLYKDDAEARGASVNGHFRVFLQPGAHLRGLLTEISVNQIGFRGAEIATEKPANALRIWCLGGSTTFDIYAPDDASAWPARVQSLVQAALPDRRVEVVNAGIPGELLSGNTEDLLTVGPRVQPDVVVVYAGPNDLRDVLRPKPGAIPHSAPMSAARHEAPTVPWRDRLDFALVRVLDRWTQARGIGQRAYPAKALRPDQRSELGRRLEATIAAALRVGARPILATHALRAQDGAVGEDARRQVAETAGLLEMDPASAIAAFRSYNELIVATSSKHGILVADVRAAVPSDPELWGDATHFLAPGSEKAAAAVAAAVLEMNP